MKVKWKKFDRYTSSNMFTEEAGEGELDNFIFTGSDTIAVVHTEEGKFLQIPIVYLQAVPEKYTPKVTQKV